MPSPPNQFAQVTIPLAHSGLARSAAIVFGVANGLLTSDPSAIAELVFDAWDDHLKSITDTEVTAGPVHVQLGTAGGIVSGDGSSSAAGTSNDARPPGNFATLIRKNTATAGRRGRGRIFYPWSATESEVNELGVIGGTQLASFQTAWEGFRSALDGAELPMALLHTDGGTPSPVTSLTVVALGATQRRRMRS